MKRKELLLGTANLGSRYGVANLNEYNKDNSTRIIKFAVSQGIKSFDTAPNYGEAELLLGAGLPVDLDSRIISKVPVQKNYTIESIMNSLELTLKNLKRESIYGIMFHDSEIYLHKNVKELSKIILDSGKVKRIGFSSYSESELIKAKKQFNNWTIFQIPENILDQRCLKSNQLRNLKEDGSEIFVRSIFLQGLLTMDLNNIREEFRKYRPILAQIKSIADKFSVSPVDVCLSYAETLDWSAGTIVAAASTPQLEEIVNFKRIELDYSELTQLPVAILDPRNWRSR